MDPNDRNPLHRNWLSCDWGTTHLRLRCVTADGRILATQRSNQGVAVLADGDTGDRAARFQTALAELVRKLGDECRADLGDCKIIVSGMASSSIGWQALPYAQVPFRLDGRDAVWQDLGPLPQLPRSGVVLVSGASTTNDVMRGEETEVLGAAAWLREQVSGHAATLILPGTHSKHVQLDGHAMTGFRTYLTGELFDLLTTHSVLRHSTSRPATGDATGAENSDSFASGVRCGGQLSLSAALFQVRTRELLARELPAANVAFLSGLLIGAEVRDLVDPSSGTPIVVCAGAALSVAYRAACHEVGLADRLIVIPPEEVERLVVRGQKVILERMTQNAP